MSSRKRSSSSASSPFKAPGLKYTTRVVASGRAFSRPVVMRASINELKDITVKSTALVPAVGSINSPAPVLLNGVAPGTSAVTRVGRRINMKSLLFKYQIQLASTTIGGSPIRVLVVMDSQTNGAAATAAGVLLTDEITSPMQLSNSRRFKVLIDEVIPCIGTAGPQAAMFTRYVKLNSNTEFNDGTAGTVADIQTGSIYAFVWQNGALATTVCAATMYSRIRFSDS